VFRTRQAVEGVVATDRRATTAMPVTPRTTLSLVLVEQTPDSYAHPATPTSRRTFLRQPTWSRDWWLRTTWTNVFEPVRKRSTFSGKWVEARPVNEAV
jgi:hypothetical protein